MDDQPEDKPKKKGQAWLDTAMAKASQVLSVGSEAADVLVHFRPTPIGISAVGLRVVDSIRHLRQQSPYEYFGEEWKSLDCFGFQDQLYAASVAKQKPEPIHGVYEYMASYRIKLDGIEFGCLVPTNKEEGEMQCDKIWIRKDVDEDDAYRALGKVLWESLGSSRAVLSVSDGNLRSSQIGFSPEPPKEILPSKLGREMLARAKKFIAQGHHRSIFLVGEPGVGKTYMMRFVAKEYGGFSLRVCMDDLIHLDQRRIGGALKLLCPDVLLIDDFDRFVGGDRYNNNEGAYMLGTLEDIHDQVKLFMVSANFSDTITEAMLRPGRFDEMNVVSAIDPELVEVMLKDVPKTIANQIKKMPIAYIEEFLKRMEILGPKEAKKEMRELAARSGLILRLNKRRTRRGKTRASGSPRQRAASERRKAASLEVKAAKLIERAEKAKDRAAAQTKKAEEQDAKKAAKPAKKKTKTASKKPVDSQESK